MPLTQPGTNSSSGPAALAAPVRGGSVGRGARGRNATERGMTKSLIRERALVCVGTRCVPSVATRVVAKIYRPSFFLKLYGTRTTTSVQHVSSQVEHGTSASVSAPHSK